MIMYYIYNKYHITLHFLLHTNEVLKFISWLNNEIKH